ncbi:MAG TPA: protein kinase [Actinomycetes bacterium]|nr:protein kinase [Actinomycetes bacterium]
MTSDAPARTVGGRYRLDRSIGSGGMGTVWEGTDELLHRRVAIKEVRFPPEIGEREQQELRERTLREARATARLSHPNVITTYDVVEDDGRPYIVMELLPTRSLSTVLREDGALPPHRVAEIGLELLAALETSHKQGILHRDVKPGNVLLTAEGRAVLTDFGIATMAGDPALTSTGVVLGSPAYMSPERARGKKPGPESDLWSLGATLYAAAEGRPPYDSDNALGTLTAVISDPVEPPSAGGPLGEAILGLLAKDPADRMDIPAARDLLKRAAADRSGATATVAPTEAVALDRAGRTEALSPVATASRPTSAPTEDPAREYAETRRSPGLLVAGLLVALLLIGGLVALAIATNNDEPTAGPEPKDTPTTQQEPTPEQTEQSTPESTPDDKAPEGFTTYTDPTGFSVAVPEGWSVVRQEGTRVDLAESGDSSTFLRIDQTDSPQEDAEKTWKELEKSVKDQLPNYEKIDIESVDYRGWEAADWEFTFGESGTSHVLNRGFVPSENKGYAIYLSAPDEQWDASLPIFQTAADTFQPAG